MKINDFTGLILNPRNFLKKLITQRTVGIIKKDMFVSIFQTEPDDVFIAGFPKSGNTWMQSLVAGLLYGIDTEFLPDKLAQEIVPDVHSRQYYKRFGKINFFKTHNLPQPDYKRVIYLVRDGRDAMVSYYHYNQLLGKQVTLEEMIKNGKYVQPAKWHIHIKQWQKNPYGAKLINIRYEDLLNQPIIELRRICDFINIERPDELLNKVISGNRIDKMRQRVKEAGGMGNRELTGNKGVEFFRKGKSGSYLDEMSPDLIDFFNKESKQELQLFNYI